MDQLKRRGFFLANRCPLCGREEETLITSLLYKGPGCLGIVVYHLWYQLGLAIFS